MYHLYFIHPPRRQSNIFVIYTGHHKGISIFLLFQSIPSGDHFLNSVCNGVHYFLFIVRNGANANQIRSILQSNAGYSADDFRKLNSTLGDFQTSHSGHFPDWVLYNKAAFASSDEFGCTSSLTGIDTAHQGNEANAIQTKQVKDGRSNKASGLRKRNQKFQYSNRENKVEPKKKKASIKSSNSPSI